MKVDFNPNLVNLRSKSIKLEIDGILVDATLRDACVEALLCLFESDRQEEGKPKYERWQLASELMKSVSGIVELTVEDIATIKKRVGKRYGPTIVGPVYNLLESVETNTKCSN